MVGCEISPWRTNFLTLTHWLGQYYSTQELPTINCQLSTVNRQLSTVNCYIFRIIPRLPLHHRWDKQM